MKAKVLESLLANESGYFSDLVTRFQALRSFRLLPNARGRNAETLHPDQIVSGILSVVSDKPGFAGTVTKGLRGLKPVGLPEDAFAGAATLAAALQAILDRPELLDQLVEVRLGDSDPVRHMSTSAAIVYREGGALRTSQYVHATAHSQFHKGAEKTFDRHSLGEFSITAETVLTPRLFRRVLAEMKAAKEREAYDALIAESLIRHQGAV